MVESSFDHNRFKPVAHHQYIKSLGHTTQYTLSDSCCETMTLGQLLAMPNAKDLMDMTLSYASIQGLPDLRVAIAALYRSVQKEDRSVQKEHVTIFAGAQEALFSVFNSVLGEGDEVIVFTPCYPPLLETPTLVNAKVVTIALQFEDQWQINIEAVAAAITPKTKAISLNFPHNPTGAILQESDRQQIASLAKAHDLYLIVDDVSLLSDFDDMGLQHDFLHSECEAYRERHKTIVVGVMSKSFGLSGLRIGWAITMDQQLRDSLIRVKSYTSICASAVDEQLALIALTNKDTIIERNNQIIKNNLRVMDEFMQRQSGGLDWVKPKAGIMGLIKSNLCRTSHEVSKQLAKQEGVLILPGDLFSIEGEYFRIGFGRENFPQILEKFERFLSV